MFYPPPNNSHCLPLVSQSDPTPNSNHWSILVGYDCFAMLVCADAQFGQFFLFIYQYYYNNYNYNNVKYDLLLLLLVVVVVLIIIKMIHVALPNVH